MENNMFAHAITVHHKLKVKTLKNMDSIDHWMENRWKTTVLWYSVDEMHYYSKVCGQ